MFKYLSPVYVIMYCASWNIPVSNGEGKCGRLPDIVYWWEKNVGEEEMKKGRKNTTQQQHDVHM
jgi:hypothetical protein